MRTLIQPYVEERQSVKENRTVSTDLLRAIINATPENQKSDLQVVSRSILDLSMFATLTTINAVSSHSALYVRFAYSRLTNTTANPRSSRPCVSSHLPRVSNLGDPAGPFGQGVRPTHPGRSDQPEEARFVHQRVPTTRSCFASWSYSQDRFAQRYSALTWFAPSLWYLRRCICSEHHARSRSLDRTQQIRWYAVLQEASSCRRS